MTCADAFHRTIEYLRVSVTDRCNLRCVYCMPAEGVPWRPHEEILGFEEIEQVVRAATRLGISKVRLTGGEPLVRTGIPHLVESLAAVPGIDELTMTTNGILLPRYAHQLATAGLKRVNISLDTLHPDRFAQITRVGKLEDTMAGIEAARQAGLDPVKINMVVIRGTNDDEVVDMARQTQDRGWHVRFIEWMPVGSVSHPLASHLGESCPHPLAIVTVGEMRERITAALGPLQPARMDLGNGPARYYSLPNAAGTIGFISPISHHFCRQCNRLRLTADGRLRLCLLSDQEIDLCQSLRQGASIDNLAALLQQGIHAKPDHHHLAEYQVPERRVMSEIGG